MKYPVTIGIAVANILVFMFFAWQQNTLMFSDTEDFLSLFWNTANFNPLTVGGQSWRLLSSMFMHGNIVHLIVNMYALYNIGHFIEQEEGSLRLFLIYMITGLFAGLSSLIFNLFVVSVGASGAIFGLYGYHIISMVMSHWRDRDILFNILINFIIFAAINYFIASYIAVDTAGHIGGLVSGALTAVISVLNRKLSPITLLVILSGSIVVFIALPKVQVRYYNMFQSLIQTEDDQQSLYKQKLTDNQLADSLKVHLNRWENVHQELKLLPHVPEGLRKDTVVLNNYISLRKKEVSFRINMIERESYIYLDSIEYVFQQFDTLSKLKYVLNYRIAPVKENFADSAKANPLQKIQVLYDKDWIETTDEFQAMYYRIGQRDSLGRWQGDVRDYYRDGTVQMKGKYLNGLHHGVFLYYTEDKKYQSAGVYEKDFPKGKWEYFYPNGKLHREVVYAGKAYTKNVYDTMGNMQVKDGTGKYITWFSNGNIQEEGVFENGLKQDIWRGYFEDGTPHYEEFYRDNVLVKGQAVDKKGNRYVYDQSSLYASPEDGYAAFNKYLRENVRKPDSFTTRSGKVKLHFLVDVNGNVRDFVVAEGLCTPCDEEAIRVVQNGPRWRPALSHGHVKVQSQAYAEVFFD